MWDQKVEEDRVGCTEGSENGGSSCVKRKERRKEETRRKAKKILIYLDILTIVNPAVFIVLEN